MMGTGETGRPGESVLTILSDEGWSTRPLDMIYVSMKNEVMDATAENRGTIEDEIRVKLKIKS